MQKLFYNPNADTPDVTDISGLKTKVDIAADFGGQVADWNMATFNEKTHQCVRLPDGTFEKKTHAKGQQENEAANQAEQDEISDDLKSVMQELGWNQGQTKKILRAMNRLNEENVPNP